VPTAGATFAGYQGLDPKFAIALWLLLSGIMLVTFGAYVSPQFGEKPDEQSLQLIFLYFESGLSAFGLILGTGLGFLAGNLTSEWWDDYRIRHRL
jgi:hypothetical protein